MHHLPNCHGSPMPGGQIPNRYESLRPAAAEGITYFWRTVLNQKPFMQWQAAMAATGQVRFREQAYYHMTVLFSRDFIPAETGLNTLADVKPLLHKNPTFVSISGIEVWNDHKDREIIVARVLKTDMLQQRHDTLKSLGIKPTFDYKPHITLCSHDEYVPDIPAAAALARTLLVGQTILLSKEKAVVSVARI